MAEKWASSIVQINVRKLLGRFNYPVTLSNSEHLTILIAPNGYGKTSLLRIVDAFFNRRYSELLLVPFEELSFQLRNGSLITVDFENQDERKVLRVRSSDQKDPFIWPKENTGHLWDSNLPDLVRWCSEVEQLKSSAETTVGSFSFPDYEVLRNRHLFERLRRTVNEAAHAIQVKKSEISDRQDQPEWLTDLQRSTPVVLIDSDRLRMRSGEDRRLRGEIPLDYYAKLIADEIAKASRRYSEESQNLDRTFPKRLAGAMRARDIVSLQKKGNVTPQQVKRVKRKRESIAHRVDKLARKYDELAAAGLIDADASRDILTPSELKKVDGRVMELYLADNEKKLAVFDDISRRIDALYSILRGRFLNKTLTVDRTRGLSVIGDAGPLELNRLSSGEQHQVRIWSQLIFDVPTGSLVLIDEPEISLHVSWQRAFLNDLERVNGVADVDFVIATHSPQIVANRPSVAVELNHVETE